MYFVTTKREGYTLFCLTPNERFALGLTADETVHAFVRDPADGWKLVRDWRAADHPLTSFLAALRHTEEPDDTAAWLALLPAGRP